MTGYVRTCDGRRLTLPALLQWSVRLTDGDPCDSFSVRFLYEAELSETLRKAVLFEAEELGRTAFTGVVDDYEIRMDKKGLLVEMTGRGLAALLLDNQVRAAEYVRAQLEDILSTYVRPYGIVNIRAAAMPPVERFVVETGYTCWQVLAGFCRHSAEIFPRFLPDGTLVLGETEKIQTVRLRQGRCISAALSDSRYGLSSRQILVNTRTGQQIAAENSEFLRRGGSCVKVQGLTGNKVRATGQASDRGLRAGKLYGAAARPGRADAPGHGGRGCVHGADSGIGLRRRGRQLHADIEGMICGFQRESYRKRRNLNRRRWERSPLAARMRRW